MTRLRQKYKKLKQTLEKRPVKVIRKTAGCPIRVVYRRVLSEWDIEMLGKSDIENRIREQAAQVIAERLIKDGLITEQRDSFYGGTEFRYEVAIVPPFKPINWEPIGEPIKEIRK